MGADVERRCMSLTILAVGLFAIVSCQIFDKRPTIYDHVKYGQPSRANQIESELKIETEFLPESCKIDDDNFFGDRAEEIAELKEKLREVTVEEGDTVTVNFKIMLDIDGTLVESSTKPAEELGQDDTIVPAKFTVGHGIVIEGWDLGVRGMCVGEVRRLVVPPQLAYGSKGYPPDIPADAALEIETTLVALKKKDLVDHYFDFLHSMHYYAFFVLGLTFLLQGFFKGRAGDKRRQLREEQKRRERLQHEEEQEEEGLEEEEAEIEEDRKALELIKEWESED